MELQKKIKAVVHCDIFEDNPIEIGYKGPYDIVMSNQCIDGACRSIEEFKAALSKLACVLKPGGKFIINCNSNINLGRCCTYGVAGQEFPSVSITREFAIAALENAGFTDLYIDGCDHDFNEAKASGTIGSWAAHQPEDFLGFLFIYATKKS